MKNSPKILYKYKEIKTALDLTRILDIIRNKKIYLPRCNQLNDPFESYMNNFHALSAGSSILNSIGERRKDIDDEFNKYGILSLTPDCRNQVMWTMYTNYYNGICMGFENLDNAYPICYKKSGEGTDIYLDYTELTKKIVKKTLMIKHELWQYENEYRIISKNNYLNIDKNLKFIILGQNLNEEIKQLLISECKEQGIEIYKTFIKPTERKVVIVNYDYNVEYIGTVVEDHLYKRESLTKTYKNTKEITK